MSAGTLDETSTFTPGEKSERVEHVMSDPHAEALFHALFQTTLPYEKRWPGTDNDSLQTRTLRIPFHRITAPTLILHGDKDGDVPIEDSDYTAAHIRGAEHHRASDEDHLGFWLSPKSADLQHVVRTFLHRHATRQ